MFNNQVPQRPGRPESAANSKLNPIQMDRMDITKMTPRELMLLERQYGAGWLKQLAPTQHMR